MGVIAEQPPDRDARCSTAALTKEVLSPSAALCDSCLGAARRRATFARAVCVSTIIFVLAHLIRMWL
jgi:hypothetical protein